jgi:hypothetical protein
MMLDEPVIWVGKVIERKGGESAVLQAIRDLLDRMDR